MDRNTRDGWSRRGVLLAGGAAALTLGGCGPQGFDVQNFYGIGSQSGIDRRVDVTRDYLLANYPAAAPMVQGARGVLYMPLVTEIALGPGASYGEGALRVMDQTVNYYSAAQASFGVQAGAQQYSHALIFNSDEALAAFQSSPGWVAGADAFYALPNGGLAMGVDTLTAMHPIIAMIFGQSGLMAGAAIEGTKYTRVTLNRP
ncbi:twin-arginine translocation pathway signal [Paracoccus sp. S-4012]|uniref:lipid-binding SYLF domain-containing protein n=1 Tax=Paracoccus sp. S-4012 TaxID=2665648 RepID=UPI0012B056FD|nr:YSC84-related protein [Paracoccus sp. S-4012]MRX50242.1 twin-arginine translocation pathway signal [Paracoccus sp. S-4012]